MSKCVENENFLWRMRGVIGFCDTFKVSVIIHLWAIYELKSVLKIKRLSSFLLRFVFFYAAEIKKQYTSL